MPYIPQAPPLIRIEGAPPGIGVCPLISEKPVTPVTAVTEMLSMPLSRFAIDGRSLEVRVAWLPETLWFVPGLEQVGRLVARGVQRGRIWTAGELADLIGIPECAHDDAATLGRVKFDFGADLVSIIGLGTVGDCDADPRPGKS